METSELYIDENSENVANKSNSLSNTSKDDEMSDQNLNLKFSSESGNEDGSNIESKINRKKTSISELENNVEMCGGEGNILDSTKSDEKVDHEDSHMSDDSIKDPQTKQRTEFASEVNPEIEDSRSIDPKQSKEKTKKYSSIIDSESEEEPQIENPKQSEEKTKKYSSIIDSESEEEPQSENLKLSIEKTKKYSSIIDSDSEEDSTQNIEGSEINDDEYQEKINSKLKKNEQRTSAKIAVDSIASIKSETQRLHRETKVDVPYHKPKNCTLKEFMVRKSREVLKNAGSNRLSLKMRDYELETYAKYLKEREEESKKLFMDEREVKNDATIIDDDANEVETSSSKIEIISNVLISPAIPTAKLEEKTLNVENLKKLIGKECQINFSPKLQGDPSLLIDLETGATIQTTPSTQLSGRDKLLERLMKNSAGGRSNSNTPITKSQLIINGNDILKNSNSCEKLENKPGARFIELKNNLQKILLENRKVDLSKKLEDFRHENEMVEKICAEEDDDDVDEADEDDLKNVKEKLFDTDNDNSNVSDEDREQDELTNNDESERDADNESDDENSSKTMKLKNKRKHKQRIVRRFDTDSDDDSTNESGFVKPFNRSSIEIEKLCDYQEEPNDDELFALCSGKFQQTQLQPTQQVDTNFQIPTESMCSQIDDSQLMVLCSGAFTSNNLNQATISDEDDENIKQSCKKVINNKKMNVILYSDDENSIINEIEVETSVLEEYLEQNDDNNRIEEETEEQIETFVDYDSDGNEVEIQMKKSERLEKARGFVENEAELTESEWGSADEDEKNMDKYDIELGDEDQFDQDKLQSEIGKIHMRKLMDEDARDIKKMQELFFYDEENDGIGRQRQFRWRDNKNDFDLNAGTKDDDNRENDNDEEEDDEEKWRKMKYEREILLEKDQTKSALSPLKINNVVCINTKNTSTLDQKKEAEKDNPFLITKRLYAGSRGSFLKRDAEILSKVAASLSSTTHDTAMDGGSCLANIQTKSGNYKNFVFAALPKTDLTEKTQKRKKADSNVENNNMPKKSKLMDQQIKKNLIDLLD